MDQQQQQQRNHAFQAGFSKAKDEFEAGYKAAIGSHQPGSGPAAPGQQPGFGGDVQQQQTLPQQIGFPQQQQNLPQQQHDLHQQQQLNQPAAGNVQPGFIGGAQPGYTGDVQTNAYQQRKNDLNQNPGAGGAFGGIQQQAYGQQRDLNQDPSAGVALGGVQQQAYREHKQALDQDPSAGGAYGTSTGPTAGGPRAGITGGNLNAQLEDEAALHSGPPQGLGSKIKSKLPHHFNDGTKVPRELREDASGQTGSGPL